MEDMLERPEALLKKLRLGGTVISGCVENWMPISAHFLLMLKDPAGQSEGALEKVKEKE